MMTGRMSTPAVNVAATITGAPSPNPVRLKLVDALLVLLLLAATIVTYWPVHRLGSINFDDPQYVFANPQVLSGLSIEGLRWAMTTNTLGNWHPLTWLSYQLDVALFGARPGPMHVENMLIHALNAAGWFILLRGMTRCRARSAIVAGLFALHPMHVESVAWISERKDVLSTFFLIASLLAYWRYTQRRSRTCYGISLVCFALALMCKPMVVTLPVLMLALDYWPLRTAFVRSVWVEKIPFAVLAIASSAITLVVQRSAGAMPDLQKLDTAHRLAGAILGYARYLTKSVWPTNLSVFYPYQWNPPLAAVVAGFILLAGITVLAWGQRRRRPHLAVGWAWFLFTLIPVIGLVQVGNQSMADRYTYVPYLGLFIMIVWEAGDIADQLSVRYRALARRAVLMIAFLLITACALLVRLYLPAWQDTTTLFTHAAHSVEAPDWNIEYHLAEGYVEKARPDLAIEHYGRTLQLKPDHAGAHNNLGTLLLHYSPQMALPHFKAAAQLRPGDWVIRYDHGVCLQALGRLPEALDEYRAALRLRPDFSEARAALAALQQQP